MYAQALICASLVVAAYQDVKHRSVYDLAWLPAIAGVAYVAIASYPEVEVFVVKVGLVGAMALAFTLTGYLGQADGIAMVLVAADPYPLSPIPPLFAAAVIALCHIGYEYAAGNARGTKSVPMEKFLKEEKWIPKAVVRDGTRKEVSKDVNVARDQASSDPTPGAMVEVTYGVPTVAYLGAGYAAFLAYLLIFSPALLASLP